MNERMVITSSDYQRLTVLREFTTMKGSMPEMATRFYENIESAQRLPPENISRNIITMNTSILLKDTATGREAELTVTYPRDADHLKRRVSVFSPIGIALLGKRTGDVVSWKTPNGVGLFQIVTITYQPEAVGAYHL